jgi:hypothetical protein
MLVMIQLRIVLTLLELFRDDPATLCCIWPRNAAGWAL